MIIDISTVTKNNKFSQTMNSYVVTPIQAFWQNICKV